MNQQHSKQEHLKQENSQKEHNRSDWILSVSAIVISLVAVFIAIFEASIMREQQRYSAWPYLEVLNSSVDTFELFVQNKGVGPAHIKDVRITVGDETISNLREWTKEKVGKVPVVLSTINGRVVSPGEKITFYQFPRESLSLLEQSLKKGFEIRVCYCSIYQECWEAVGIQSSPVSECTFDSQLSYKH